MRASALCSLCLSAYHRMFECSLYSNGPAKCTGPLLNEKAICVNFNQGTVLALIIRTF